VLAMLALNASEPAWAQSSVRDPAGVKQERDEVRRNQR
jgi:murein hydrolase activator